MTENHSKPGNAKALIDSWRREARQHREAQEEIIGRLHDHADEEEWHLHKVDADRYEACADQLESISAQGTPRPGSYQKKPGGDWYIRRLIQNG